MKPQLRMDFQKVVTITLAYIVVNVFMAILVHAILSSSYSIGPSAEYSFTSYLGLSVIIGSIAGIMGGVVMVKINKSLFRKRSFSVALMITAVVFILVFFIVNLVSSIVTANLTLTDPTSEQVKSKSFELMFNPLTLAILAQWGMITLFTLFILQVSDKFGPNKLWKFVQGYYFHPREEERIFMFVDLRSSTTIAEKISHHKYFELLSKLFADITDPILDHEGEIYQYVGDEIVITWTLEKGIANNNCLNCFQAIEDKLADLGLGYEQRFDVRPELKAGIHHGHVTAGEIGIIKKDIVYTGDVLNTAARIQEQCNNYKVNLIISQETLNLFRTDNLKTRKLGEISLRGKSSEVELVTVQQSAT